MHLIHSVPCLGKWESNMTNDDRVNYTKKLHDDNLEHIHAIAKKMGLDRCPLCGVKLEWQ